MKEFGVKEDSVRLYDETVVQLPMEQLRKVREREREREILQFIYIIIEITV